MLMIEVIILYFLSNKNLIKVIYQTHFKELAGFITRSQCPTISDVKLETL